MEGSTGATGDAQQKVNDLADAAQSAANAMVDLGEEAIESVLDTLSSTLTSLGNLVDEVRKTISG